MSSLLFFDSVNPKAVDVLLLSHFHLDQAASLPYFMEQTGFRGRIFTTHPMKVVIQLLLGDYLSLMAMKRGFGGGGDDDLLYTEAELQSCIYKIKLNDYHQMIKLNLL